MLQRFQTRAIKEIKDKNELMRPNVEEGKAKDSGQVEDSLVRMLRNQVQQ